MKKQIAQMAMEMAIKYGATDARISFNESSGSSISILNNELDRIQSSIGSSLFLQLFIDGRYGTFSTNKMSKSELEQFIQNAVASTKLLAQDPCRHLPDKELYYKGANFDLKQRDCDYQSIGADKKKEFLFAIANEIDMADPRIISNNCEYGDSEDMLYVIDSNGFEGETHQTLFSVSSECSIRDKGDARPQNWWYDSSIFFDKLPIGCGKKSLERTLRMLDGKSIKPGKYPIVIENTVSSKMVSTIFNALNGMAIQQKNSFLNDSLGKKLFPESVTILDTPLKEGELGARFFDNEGLATSNMEIIREGVVEKYFINTYFADKLGCKPTIDSPSVPSFLPFGEPTQETMMKNIGTGVLITGFNGGNCNSATGDFSFGIEGFFFRNGIIIYPVKEMNISGNMLSLWEKVIHIGNDPREGTRWKIPTLSFDNTDLA